MTTQRERIIAGLRAQLEKSELSDERRQQLKHALDYQLEAGWKPPAYPATPAERERVANHRYAQASGVGSAPRPGSSYNEQHSLAAQQANLPAPIMGADSGQILQTLQQQRKIALQYVQAFTVRMNAANTPEAKERDRTNREEWAAFAKDVAAEIGRLRGRIRQAVHRSR